MTMHLEGPWLSTTGKRKGKQKFRNAEEARKHRELEDSWKALQKKWGLEQEEKKRKRALEAKPFTEPYLQTPAGRGTKHIPSLNGGLDMTPALKAKEKVYTGTKILGIGTMHKSNAVPIFSDEEAHDIAKMRR